MVQLPNVFSPQKAKKEEIPSYSPMKTTGTAPTWAATTPARCRHCRRYRHRYHFRDHHANTTASASTNANTTSTPTYTNVTPPTPKRRQQDCGAAG